MAARLVMGMAGYVAKRRGESVRKGIQNDRDKSNIDKTKAASKFPPWHSVANGGFIRAFPEKCFSPIISAGFFAVSRHIGP